MSVSPRLHVVTGIGLVLSLLWCVAGAAPAHADSHMYTVEDFFPLQIGNTWSYGRTFNGTFEKVDLSAHRTEMLNGFATTVLQLKRGTDLLEEWWVSTSIGLSLNRVKYFGTTLLGSSTPMDVRLTFNPPLRVTDDTPAPGESVFSTGMATAEIGTAPPFTTIERGYDAASTLGPVGDLASTPGAISIGTRSIISLGIDGAPPIGGTRLADIFWGRMLGPMTLDLGGSGIQEKKWLEDTNVDRRDTVIFSAHSPTSRATMVDGTVTAFAVMQNAGSSGATWCAFAPLPDKDGPPPAFSYAETDPQTNAVIGPLNPIFDIPAGGLKTFVFSMTPNSAFAFKRFRFVHDCWETARAARFTGVNDFGLISTDDPTLDILMIGITQGNTGIVDLPGADGSAAFALATANLGVAGKAIVYGEPIDPATPVSVTICPTDKDTGQCMQPPAAEVETEFEALANFTYALFVKGEGEVPFDPAKHRVAARARDMQGNQVGEWSAAVRTLAPQF